jgi:hypothetical protein
MVRCRKTDQNLNRVLGLMSRTMIFPAVCSAASIGAMGITHGQQMLDWFGSLTLGRTFGSEAVAFLYKKPQLMS